jgi:hypothetical protein
MIAPTPPGYRRIRSGTVTKGDLVWTGMWERAMGALGGTVAKSEADWRSSSGMGKETRWVTCRPIKAAPKPTKALKAAFAAHSESVVQPPRWRVYPDEKPVHRRGDTIFIACADLKGKLLDVDCATTTFYLHSDLRGRMAWPLWMPMTEGLPLFPAVPRVKP